MAQEGYLRNLSPAENNSPMGMVVVPQTPYDGFYNQYPSQFSQGSIYNVQNLELQNFASTMQQASATGEQQNNFESKASFGGNARGKFKASSDV